MIGGSGSVIPRQRDQILMQNLNGLFFVNMFMSIPNFKSIRLVVIVCDEKERIVGRNIDTVLHNTVNFYLRDFFMSTGVLILKENLPLGMLVDGRTAEDC